MAVNIKNIYFRALFRIIQNYTHMKIRLRTSLKLLVVMMLFSTVTLKAQDKIVHDAEYYILKAQHGDEWKKQDKEIQKKLQCDFLVVDESKFLKDNNCFVNELEVMLAKAQL